jgi:hypothetical protein
MLSRVKSRDLQRNGLRRVVESKGEIREWEGRSWERVPPLEAAASCQVLLFRSFQSVMIHRVRGYLLLL